MKSGRLADFPEIGLSRILEHMFGSHLSIAGGLHKALLEAERLDMACVQIFTKSPNSWGMTPIKPEATQKHLEELQSVKVQNQTKNQQQWKTKPLDPAAIDAWRSHCDRLEYGQTVSHDSYLINLASPEEGLRRKSIDLFVEELRRCVVLKIPYLVTHPGAHMGDGEDVGLKRVAAALDEVHAAIPPDGVVTCLEITAGQGTSLGYKLEHLAEIIALAKCPERLAVCFDTAHLFAAGYDFRGRKYQAFMKAVEATVGIKRVKVWHLNDSKKELGSRVDRHEHIGRGTIGLEGFKPIVRDKAFANVPKILETAKAKDEAGRDWDAVNLETLKSLM
jgi:deoxyribonuclease-4